MEQHRLNDEQNILAAGVVRPKLGAFRPVKPALKERAEDPRLNFRPIMAGCIGKQGQFISVERQHFVIVEQPPIKARYTVYAKIATFPHRPKQPPRSVWKLTGVKDRLTNALTHKLRRQQLHVLRKQRKEHLHKEVGNLGWGKPPFKRLRDFGKTPRNRLCNRRHRFNRA